MKRSWNLLCLGTFAATVCGIALSLAQTASSHSVSVASRVLLSVSVMMFVILALWRPRAMRESAMSGKIDGMNVVAKRPDCRFEDVAANEEAKRSLMELADYLRDPEKYARYGARMPRGVMLYGPPGTGKTLLARALAGEAGVPFFALSGSDFVQMYVGVGAGRVRELFKTARKAGKCVIFIDEIDAMGKSRDNQNSDERDQTLNALLSEMSGFRTGDGVLVLAATNRLDSLDPALLRAGRFDRQIEVGLPGREERLSILKLHSRNKPMDEDVDLEKLARETTRFSGASLESLLNEAAIAAAGRDAEKISAQDVREAFYRTVAGADHAITANDQEKLAIALHEAGHALAIRLLMPENHLARVSILPAGGGAAGYSLSIPPERVMLRQEDIENQVQSLLAGRAAEIMIGGEGALTAGASNDLARATELVGAMVMELGMGGEPAVSFRTLGRVCGGGNDGAEKCRKKLSELFDRVTRLLSQHAQTLVKLADALMEREALAGEEIDEILGTSVSNERQVSAK